MPDHYVMDLAANQDYEGFYREEIAIRRAMIFPPVCDMCVFCIAGIDEEKTKTASSVILERMKIRLYELQPKTPVRLLGPVKCSYGKINGKFRYRIIMKCKNSAEMRGFISGILRESAKMKELSGITFYADMNGDTGI
jgi:primosomal protein N' (replication factor Y)